MQLTLGRAHFPLYHNSLFFSQCQPTNSSPGAVLSVKHSVWQITDAQQIFMFIEWKNVPGMHDVRQCQDKITCWQQEADESQTANPEIILHPQFTLNVPITLWSSISKSRYGFVGYTNVKHFYTISLWLSSKIQIPYLLQWVYGVY